MAEASGEKKTRPISTPTIVIIGVGAIAVLILLINPNLLGGKPAAVNGPVTTAPTTTAPGTTAPTTTASTTPVTVTKASTPTVASAPPKPDDPFATFLVKFGRSNPFSPLGTGSAGSSSTKPQQSTLNNLQSRLQALQQGQTAAGSKNPNGNTQRTAKDQDRAREGFLLTGIVREKTLAYAVIEKDEKGYIVTIGDVLGKTGYAVRSIGEDSVIIAIGEKELVLSLRRSKT